MSPIFDAIKKSLVVPYKNCLLATELAYHSAEFESIVLKHIPLVLKLIDRSSGIFRERRETL